MPRYRVTEDATNDLLEIWLQIAADSVDLANRIQGEFRELFEMLARMPLSGTVRPDLTKKPLRLFRKHSFFVAYYPAKRPIEIVAVLRDKRNIKRILRDRLT